MKKAGIVILIVGLLFTVVTGFNFVTKKKVVDVGSLQITQNKNHNIAWSPILGAVVMVIGGGMYLVGPKKD